MPFDPTQHTSPEQVVLTLGGATMARPPTISLANFRESFYQHHLILAQHNNLEEEEKRDQRASYDQYKELAQRFLNLYRLFVNGFNNVLPIQGSQWDASVIQAWEQVTQHYQAVRQLIQQLDTFYGINPNPNPVQPQQPQTQPIFALNPPPAAPQPVMPIQPQHPMPPPVDATHVQGLNLFPEAPAGQGPHVSDTNNTLFVPVAPSAQQTPINPDTNGQRFKRHTLSTGYSAQTNVDTNEGAVYAPRNTNDDDLTRRGKEIQSVIEYLMQRLVEGNKVFDIAHIQGKEYLIHVGVAFLLRHHIQPNHITVGHQPIPPAFTDAATTEQDVIHARATVEQKLYDMQVDLNYQATYQAFTNALQGLQAAATRGPAAGPVRQPANAMHRAAHGGMFAGVNPNPVQPAANPVPMPGPNP